MSASEGNRANIPASVTALLQSAAAELAELLRRLVASYGEPFDCTRGVNLITGTPYRWPDLDLTGRRMQSRLLLQYEHFCQLARTVIKGRCTEDALKDFDTSAQFIRAIIERDATSAATTSAAAQQVNEALHQQLDILNG